MVKNIGGGYTMKKKDMIRIIAEEIYEHERSIRLDKTVEWFKLTYISKLHYYTRAESFLKILNNVKARVKSYGDQDKNKDKSNLGQSTKKQKRS